MAKAKKVPEVISDENETIVDPASSETTTPAPKPKTINKPYEEWKVKVNYAPVLDNFGKEVGRKFVGYEKDAQKAIRRTSIAETTAEELNSQSENTLVHLYPVE